MTRSQLQITKVGLRSLRGPTVFVLLLFTHAAIAQEITVKEFSTCRTIPNELERVTCYDQVFDRYSEVQSKDENSRDAEPEIDAQNFGRKYLRDAADADSPKILAVVVVGAEKDSTGRWRFTFEHGQTWRQIEVGYLRVPDEFPVDASIIPGLLGSFALRIGDRGRPVKVKRIR